MSKESVIEIVAAAGALVISIIAACIRESDN